MTKRDESSLLGKTFRNLRVIKFSRTVKKPQKNNPKKTCYETFWTCECSCGYIGDYRRGNLTHSNLNSCKSCGDKARARAQRKGSEHIWGLLIARIRISAKRRNYEYSLTEDYLENLLISQEFKCSLSKVPIFAGHIEKKDYGKIKITASLDRIDSTKGYVEGNVQWVHRDINWMKQDYTQQEFIDYCKLVAKNN